MLLVLFVYLASVISWGAILYQLTKVTLATMKNEEMKRPPLLVPLAVASFALFIENLYFGVVNFARYVLNDDTLFLTSQKVESVFIIKLLVAVSGVMLLISVMNKKE